MRAKFAALSISAALALAGCSAQATEQPTVVPTTAQGSEPVTTDAPQTTKPSTDVPVIGNILPPLWTRGPDTAGMNPTAGVVAFDGQQIDIRDSGITTLLVDGDGLPKTVAHIGLDGAAQWEQTYDDTGLWVSVDDVTGIGILRITEVTPETSTTEEGRDDFFVSLNVLTGEELNRIPASSADTPVADAAGKLRVVSIPATEQTEEVFGSTLNSTAIIGGHVFARLTEEWRDRDPSSESGAKYLKVSVLDGVFDTRSAPVVGLGTGPITGTNDIEVFAAVAGDLIITEEGKAGAATVFALDASGKVVAQVEACKPTSTEHWMTDEPFTVARSGEWVIMNGYQAWNPKTGASTCTDGSNGKRALGIKGVTDAGLVVAVNSDQQTILIDPTDDTTTDVTNLEDTPLFVSGKHWVFQRNEYGVFDGTGLKTS